MRGGKWNESKVPEDVWSRRGATPSRSVWRRRSINHLSPDTLSAPCHPVGDPVSVTLMTTQTTIQGAGAISVESLGRCCEPGNENIVGNFALVCCPGGRLEYSHKNRPPLAKMWRQEQFRWVIVHWLRAGIYNTVCDSYFRKTVKLIEKITQLS